MVDIHLVSMPWANKHIPNIQIGALKAYLRLHLPQDRIFGHHLHLYIPSHVFSDREYHDRLDEFQHEGNYLLLLLRAFGEDPLLKTYAGRQVRSEIEEHAARFGGISLISEEKLSRLQEVTDSFLDKLIVQKSSDTDKVIVGFTTNFFQN
jgi:hypothetical protein